MFCCLMYYEQSYSKYRKQHTTQLKHCPSIAVWTNSATSGQCSWLAELLQQWLESNFLIGNIWLNPVFRVKTNAISQVLPRVIKLACTSGTGGNCRSCRYAKKLCKRIRNNIVLLGQIRKMTSFWAFSSSQFTSGLFTWLQNLITIFF